MLQPDSGSDALADAISDAIADALADRKVRRSILWHASLCSRVSSVRMQPDFLANALSDARSHARSHARSNTIAHSDVLRSIRCHASSQLETNLC